jgi:ectoine hydroxylase-related dioxygenase (phytanoyl-CoA dioxygenase family)
VKTDSRFIPSKSYGILHQDSPASQLDEVVEQVKRLGYALLDSGYSPDDLCRISENFNATRSSYIAKHGESRLRKLNEFHTIRALLTHGGPLFMSLAINANLLSIISKLIRGKFILNQQNGLINPPSEDYSQSAWHRDLPYQHYVSNTPLAINALFCVDSFTNLNGSTFVLPATHLTSSYPSDNYIKHNALQIQAKAGQYIILDCMLFHAGGFNRSGADRRAVNHVYTIPYFKQQIKLPGLLTETSLNARDRELIGCGFEEPDSIDQYFATRET